jgi:prepilin-type processing-associated H-X9-DG protein/prepilin-type N-terminal cleavage/methylation domain-containing protein
MLATSISNRPSLSTPRSAAGRLVASGKPVVDGAGRLAVPVCPLQAATDNSDHGAQVAAPAGRLRPGHVAFTLVELLVVVAVIALLSALAFPALRSAIETSRRATCAGNLKTLATAVLGYVGENNGCLPYAYDNPNIIKPGPTPWFWAVGDYFGGQYTRAQEVVWINKRSLRALPSCLYCPSAKRETNNSTPYDISYGLNTALTGRYPTEPLRRVSSIQRPSRMILLADAMSYSERNQNAWGVATQSVSKRHGTVANVAWLDGHVSREPLAELATNASYWDPSKN